MPKSSHRRKSGGKSRAHPGRQPATPAREGEGGLPPAPREEAAPRAPVSGPGMMKMPRGQLGWQLWRTRSATIDLGEGSEMPDMATFLEHHRAHLRQLATERASLMELVKRAQGHPELNSGEQEVVAVIAGGLSIIQTELSAGRRNFQSLTRRGERAAIAIAQKIGMDVEAFSASLTHVVLHVDC